MKRYSSTRYTFMALLLFALFGGYVLLTANLFRGACDPGREWYMALFIAFAAAVVVLSILNFILLPKIFRDNTQIFDQFVPAPLKVVVSALFFGGVGYHTYLLSSC